MPRQLAVFHTVAASVLSLSWSASLTAAAQPNSNGGGLSFSASSLESQNNLGSTMGTSASANARVATGRVLIVHEKGHPLLEQVCAQLTARLSACPLIAEVGSKTTDLKAGTALPDGSRAPDLFLTLEMPLLKESGWITRSLETTVLASLGSTPWNSHNSIVDETTPPLVQFQWDGRLEHKSTMKGLERPRYRSVAEDLGKELGNSLSNALVKLAADHGAVPVLPDYLYGPYQPLATPRLLERLQARRAFSYYGLLTHNETFWTFQLRSNAVPQLQAMIEQLAAEQWKSETVQLTNTESYFIRAKQGDLRLEIFSRTKIGFGQGLDQSEAPREFVAHLRQPFSRAEREAAWDRLLSDHAPLETVLLFSELYTGRQRQRFYETLENANLASPLGYLTLARARLGQRDTNAAVNALVRAKALLATLPEPSTTESQIKTVAKEIAPKKELDLRVTADTYRQLGFLEITNAPQAFSAESQAGEPLRLFSTSETGEPRTLCLWVKTPSANQRPLLYPWTAIRTESHGRSTQSSSFELNGRSDRTISLSDQPYTLKVRVTPGDGAFRYEVSVDRW